MRIVRLRKTAEAKRLELQNDLGDSYNDEVEVSFRVKGDAKSEMVEMLKYISDIGGVGHSFEIVVDPDLSDYREEFFFDGDGADGIDDIKIDGEKTRFG